MFISFDLTHFTLFRDKFQQIIHKTWYLPLSSVHEGIRFLILFAMSVTFMCLFLSKLIKRIQIVDQLSKEKKPAI